MKNTGLAPIIALLVLLGIAWVGLFGLSQASATASRTETRPPATAPREAGGTDRPSGTTGGNTERPRERATENPDDSDSSFLDRLAGREEPATADRDRREPTGTFLDRLAGREDASVDRGTDARVEATERNPEDPSGLSNRGAAGLILVLLLVVLVGAKGGKR